MRDLTHRPSPALVQLRLALPMLALVVALGLPRPGVADPFNKTDQDTYEYTLALEKGARYINARNYPRAFSVYEKALTHEVQEPDLYYNLVIVGEALKKWEKVALYAQAYLRYVGEDLGPEGKEIQSKSKKAAKEAGAYGSFGVICEPEGQLVLVDGAYFGVKGVQEASLPAGSYEVTCYRKDYHPGKKTIKVSADAPSTWKVKMEEIIYYGEIELTTKSAGVQVFLNDKLVGETPLKEPLKVQANREHVLRLEKAGHDAWMRAVDVKKDKKHRVDAMLEVTPGDEDDAAW